ncbi:hypothetical protein H0H87_005723, partial [Tephrocybe sp. NHM501043]
MGSIVHGAQETTSSILSRFISLLALDLVLQSRLRGELLDARQACSAILSFHIMQSLTKRKNSDEDFDFRELDSLPLLDAVIRETLRLFAPVTFVWR